MKMKMYTISYKPYDAKNRTLLNFALFGRINYKKTKTKRYGYYNPGMLDNIQFSRLMGSKIIVKSLDNININLLNIFGEFEIKEEDRDETKMFFETGREHWERLVIEKQYQFTLRNNRKVLYNGN